MEEDGEGDVEVRRRWMGVFWRVGCGYCEVVVEVGGG